MKSEDVRHSLIYHQEFFSDILYTSGISRTSLPAPRICRVYIIRVKHPDPFVLPWKSLPP